MLRPQYKTQPITTNYYLAPHTIASNLTSCDICLYRYTFIYTYIDIAKISKYGNYQGARGMTVWTSESCIELSHGYVCTRVHPANYIEYISDSDFSV